MKLFGITMVRNESDLIDLTIRHHLRIGCAGVLVVDNGSSDRTPAILSRLARHDSRIKWTTDAGPYRQSEIMTALARQAHALGADWVIPFDADEYWWCRPDKTIPAVLDAAVDVAALSAPVVNFVQHRRRERSSRRGLLHMRMRAVPVPPAEEGMNMVTAGQIAFVEIVYPPKVVFRPNPDVIVSRGNHSVEGALGPSVATSDLSCLHAPLRSRRALEAQADHGRRTAEVSTDPDVGWQARRWLQLWEHSALGEEWAANSYLEGSLDVYGQRHTVEPDDRLRDAVLPILLRHPIR